MYCQAGNNSLTIYVNGEIYKKLLQKFYISQSKKHIYSSSVYIMTLVVNYLHIYIYIYIYIYICNTFTPQIKGKCHCINVILHWLWNVNEIYALISVRTSR